MLLRHASTDESDSQVFTGWNDVPLNDRGSAQAREAARSLAEHGLLPDRVHSSVLQRATTTAELVVSELDRAWVPRRVTWQLNERHYGSLQGQRKEHVVREHGHETYAWWRRSLHGLPPAQAAEHHAALKAEYADRGIDIDVPRAESLAMVRDRVADYWQRKVRAELDDVSTILLVGHSGSLRALVMELEQLDEDTVTGVNVPVCMPLVYQFDAGLQVLGKGSFLDPEGAEAAAEAMAREGTTPTEAPPRSR